MKQDLFNKYGRFYEIPACLSRLGHDIELVCHNYRNVPNHHRKENRNLSIVSWSLGLNPLSGFWQHYKRLNKKITESRPDLIIAASDCFQVIVGAALARRHSIPFIADLYDNFAAYGASRFPGVLQLFYRALNTADAITVVSKKLMEHVRQRVGSTERIYLLENAVSEDFLVNQNRQESRNYFDFKDDEIYIGTAGYLGRKRGTDFLIETYLDLAEENANLHLVLAGAREKKLMIPDRSNIHYLAQLEHGMIPVLFSALDTGIILVKDDEFGRYCFPQKYHEMVACNLPLVASNIGEMSVLLGGASELLFESGSKADLKRAIRYQLNSKQALQANVPSWEQQAHKLDNIIKECLSGHES